MDTSQASTSNSNDYKLQLEDKEISVLLVISEKSRNINSIRQSKLKNIYEDIDYACSHNIEFNSVETTKNINGSARCTMYITRWMTIFKIGR